MDGLVNFGMNWGTFGVLVGGVAFGVGYNAAIAYSETQKWIEGYRAVAVVVGTLGTLALSALFIGVDGAAVVLLSFCATGAPMVWGDIRRAVAKRAAAEQKLKAALKDGGGKAEADGNA